MAEQDLDLTQISPEDFAQLVGGSSDEELISTFHAVGTDKVLNRIFEGMQQRFRPDKAEGVTADVQFVIEDDGEEHTYTFKIADGTCAVQQGAVESPKTTITTGFLPFAKLVTGHEDGMKLFMTRKLKVGGDLMFSQRVMTFFDRPKP